jgi:hypothetical protein
MLTAILNVLGFKRRLMAAADLTEAATEADPDVISRFTPSFLCETKSRLFTFCGVYAGPYSQLP